MPERSAAPLHLLAGRRLGRGDRAYRYSLLPRRGERDELHRQDRRGRQAAQQDAQMRDARPGKYERLRYPPSLFLESTEDIKDDKTLDIFENVMAGTTTYFTNNSTNVVGSVHIPDGMTERIVSDV